MKLTHTLATLLRRQALWVLALLLCGSAIASDDPPGRVGRLGDLHGQVWLYTPDAGEWVDAVRNRPLTTGDRLSTDAGARAEVRIGSTTVRLDSGTELEVLRIDDTRMALHLHGGSIAVRLRSSESAGQFELRTAEGRFLTPRAGRYRFDRFDETSHVTVWIGEAVYEGPGSALTVYTGQRAEFWMVNQAAQYSITEPKRDDFAAWAADQDRRDQRSAASRYVSPEMTGAEDLDRYGRWEQSPDYGAVWIPSQVPYGWAPYGAGHWAWVSPWGWTWVDDMPWGFAPFHYGRWAWWRNSWCWVPGTYVRRPVYAPALVGWIGGPHLSVSISAGSRPGVGWFPLAPREVYVPAYPRRVTPRYVQQVNITHVTTITNVTTIVQNPRDAVTSIDYRNRRYPHALTVVPQEVMTERRPVAPIAAQLRNSPQVQQLVQQPVRRIVVPAPPVAAPVVPPAEVRRMHIHREPNERREEGSRPPLRESLVGPGYGEERAARGFPPPRTQQQEVPRPPVTEERRIGPRTLPLREDGPSHFVSPPAADAPPAPRSVTTPRGEMRPIAPAVPNERDVRPRPWPRERAGDENRPGHRDDAHPPPQSLRDVPDVVRGQPRVEAPRPGFARPPAAHHDAPPAVVPPPPAPTPPAVQPPVHPGETARPVVGVRPVPNPPQAPAVPAPAAPHVERPGHGARPVERPAPPQPGNEGAARRWGDAIRNAQ
jgi:hypothetical protein